MRKPPETTPDMIASTGFAADRDVEHEITHPVSREAARDRFRPLVGVLSDLTFVRLRDGWWDRLAAATSPEEKLTCERMIDAINIAYGLNMHERGAKIAEENRASQDAERRTEADECALRRWR